MSRTSNKAELIVNYVNQFVQENGYSPSVREIGEAVGLRSTASPPFHVKSKPPKQEGVCDACGGALIQRDDDKVETVRNRLKVYHQETEPLKGYYEKKGVLVPVDNQPTIEATTKVIMEALGI